MKFRYFHEYFWIIRVINIWYIIKEAVTRFIVCEQKRKAKETVYQIWNIWSQVKYKWLK